MAQLLKKIFGHEAQIKKLLTAQKSGHLPHALLFVGPSGVGRKRVAWALAQTLLCKEEELACGNCVDCLQVEKEINTNILFIEPEGLSIKVEAIRPLFRFLSLQSSSLARVVIMDSAHQMNPQAAGSLLKILEEPPSDTYFILISNHLSSLPITIRSRVQALRFSPLNLQDLQAVLEQNQMSDHEGSWLLQAAQGSLDNIEKWRENKEARLQSFNLLKAALLKEELYSLGDLTDLVKEREKALFVCLCWQQILRDAFILKVGSKSKVIHPDQTELLNLLQALPLEKLSLFFQNTVQLEWDLKSYVDSSLAFDNLFILLRDKSSKLKIKPR